MEDWHAKVCLLGVKQSKEEIAKLYNYIHSQVIWKRLYNASSATDAGTLFHFRNLINRRDVMKNPTSNVSACEDFFLHIVETHILSACMTAFGVSSVSDSQTCNIFSSGDSLQQRHALLEAID